jgi:hypothetical protein
MSRLSILQQLQINRSAAPMDASYLLPTDPG